MLFAGRYHLLGELGRGGMARVYRAEDLERGGEVAIKILDVDTQDETLRTRFFSELLLTSSILHPNIAAIHDFGVTGERQRPFLVMELLRGVDLAQHLQKHGPLRPAQALHLFDGALDALAAIHARGIVHKDLKPSNLFLHQPEGEEERLILMDFGISHSLELRRATAPALLSCTPHYSPPEYFMHQEVSPAMDVYQMSLVVLEALLGWPLVEGKTLMACIQAHTTGSFNLPPLLRRGPLAPLIEGGLALDPAERFPHAGALRDALLDIHPEVLTLTLEMATQLGVLPRR